MTDENAARDVIFAPVIDFSDAKRQIEVNKRAEEEAPANPVHRLWWILTQIFGNGDT